VNKLTKNKASTLVLFSLALVGCRALGSYAQQLHNVRQEKSPIGRQQASSSTLQTEIKNLLKTKQSPILADAVSFALSALPKNNDPKELRTALQHLNSLKTTALAEYEKLPAAQNAKQKKEQFANLYDITLLILTIELLERHELGEINLHILKEDIQGHKNLRVILQDLAGKTGHNK